MRNLKQKPFSPRFLNCALPFSFSAILSAFLLYNSKQGKIWVTFTIISALAHKRHIYSGFGNKPLGVCCYECEFQQEENDRTGPSRQKSYWKLKWSFYNHGRQKNPKNISEHKMSKLEMDALEALTSDHFVLSRLLAKNRKLRLLWSQSHPDCSGKDWKDVTWSSCHSLATLIGTPELLELKLTSSEQKKF